MKNISRKGEKRKTIVAQFGEGNFLRAFVDYMIDIANERGVFDGGVSIIKPIAFGSLDNFIKQDCAYTVILRGVMDGKKYVEKRIISSVNEIVNPFLDYNSYINLAKRDELRFIVSNTTEAGIAYDSSDKFERKPANSYPGKLVQFLYARFNQFQGDPDKGLIILPVELIEANGKKLRECVLKLIDLWVLPEAFANWVKSSCTFCSTLVDRIVTGYPKEEAAELENQLGYRDELMVTAEPFGLWVIESNDPEKIQKALPFDEAGLPVVFTQNLTPYRDRKVRILNGAHTSTVLGAYLVGLDTVGQCMSNQVIRRFMEKAVFDEIVPTVKLPESEVLDFANSVMERFENPFIQHALLSISLNSVSKWKARVLPSLKDYFNKNAKLPPCLTFSLASLIAFYRTSERGDSCLIGKRASNTYEIHDDAAILDFFAEYADKETPQLVHLFLSRRRFWGEDLRKLGNMSSQIVDYLNCIEEHGMLHAINQVIAKD